MNNLILNCRAFSRLTSGLVLLIATLISCSKVYSQSSGSFWTDVPENAIAARGIRHTIPQKYRTMSLNVNGMRQLIAQAPQEKNTSLRSSGVIITLPLPEGKLARFRFVESPVMAPSLAARFPEIHSFVGIGLDDRDLSCAFDFTTAGFHGMIHSTENGLSFIDPYSQGDIDNYIVYAKKDYIPGLDKAFFEPDVLGTETDNAKKIGELVKHRRAQQMEAQPAETSGDQLRTYRIAIAATGEYTAFHGGTKAAALSGITTTLHRINFIYIREVDVRMILVANETSVIYTNSATDPYSNGDAFSMISQVQTDIDRKIGSAKYDIGHVFGTNSGGLAYLGVVCQAGIKARGVTGSAAPIGDAFDVDYVAHEMGHQFGANHSFNGDGGSCAGNVNPGTAYEPGSGSTIMAYAGICGSQDLQPHSDAYFHVASYDEIFAYTELGEGNSCAVITTRENTAPVPAISTPNNLTIPKQTPFTISGTAVDAEKDPVTYNWEEYDLGPEGSPDAPTGNAPIFRSFTATSRRSRTFPTQSDLLNNTSTTGEILPTYARTLHFNLTVRDNYSGGGGVAWARLLTVKVSGAAGPFRVTFPNKNVALAGGSVQMVTWNVSGTNALPINTKRVNIRLSTDGGVTFPTILASNRPNDGTQRVRLPNITTTTARIKVEAVGNIFFDISNSNFKITATLAPPVTFSSPGAGPESSSELSIKAGGSFVNSLYVSPNPANRYTTISFSVDRDQTVQLLVFNAEGKLISGLYKGRAQAGKKYLFEWSAGSNPSGMYISRLITQKGVLTKKIILLP
ncbi:MAG TPA: zinc-dependent metalloprotease family protein [Chitinophagaceae bacterium]